MNIEEICIRSKRKNSALDFFMAIMIISLLAFGDYAFLTTATQIMALFVLVLGLKTKDWRISRFLFRFLIWGGMFTFFCVFSLQWSDTINRGGARICVSIAQAVLIGFEVLLYFDITNEIEKILKYFWISAAMFCLRFLLTVPISSWGKQTRFENGSLFGSNACATTIVLAALCMLIYNYYNKKLKMAHIMLSVLFVLVSVLMGTRSGVICFGFGLVCFALYISRNSIELVRNILLVAVTCFVAYYLIMNNELLYNSLGYRIETMLFAINGMNTDKSTATRMAFIPDAIRVFKQHPLFGVGLDGYRYLNSIQPSYAHNNYVELLADLGIVGFSIFYFFPIYLLIKTLQTKKSNPLPFVIISTLLLLDFTTVSYEIEFHYMLFGIVLSMVELKIREYRKGN